MDTGDWHALSVPHRLGLSFPTSSPSQQQFLSTYIHKYMTLSTAMTPPTEPKTKVCPHRPPMRQSTHRKQMQHLKRVRKNQQRSRQRKRAYVARLEQELAQLTGRDEPVSTNSVAKKDDCLNRPLSLLGYRTRATQGVTCCWPLELPYRHRKDSFELSSRVRGPARLQVLMLHGCLLMTFTRECHQVAGDR